MRGFWKKKLLPSLSSSEAEQTKNSTGDMSSRSDSAIKYDQEPFLIWNAPTGMRHIKHLFCVLFPDIFFPTVLPHPNPQTFISSLM